MNRELMEIRDGRLFFDGCDLTQIAEGFGTPLYVYSQNVMKARIAEIRRVFLDGHPNNRVAYAAKAFCCTAMLKLAEKEGLCVDVVSGGELYTAIKAGFPAERIEFNGNNKTEDELKMAVGYGIGRIIVDSLQELDLLEKICRSACKKAKVLFRITPGVKADSHDFIVTGKKDSKFGIPLDDDVILPYVKKALDSEWIDFLGLHYHVGSQLFDNSAHLAALDITLRLAEKIWKNYGYAVEEINLGGGFGIQYTTEERRPYAYFLEPLMARLSDFCACHEEMFHPALVIEPGRSIVGEAGMELYTIGSTKDITGVRNYPAVDGGMWDNIRPALYGAKYTAVLANRADEPADKTVTVCGKCCESGDILIRDIDLPAPKAGDVLAVFSTGAYGYSMASNYNRNTVPGVVFIKDGKAEWAVKPQTYEYITALDVIPESLSEE